MSEPGAGAGALLQLEPDAELLTGSPILTPGRAGPVLLTDRAENRDCSTGSAGRERPLSCMHSLQNGQTERGGQRDKQTERETH